MVGLFAKWFCRLWARRGTNAALVTEEDNSSLSDMTSLEFVLGVNSLHGVFDELALFCRVFDLNVTSLYESNAGRIS